MASGASAAGHSPGEHDERSDPHPRNKRTRRQHGRVPEPSRVRAQGARQPQPECLGLYRRRCRDRDHDAPQPHGAGRDRLPAAGAAQCRSRRCLRRAVRPQIAPAGDDGAGRCARDLRSRRRRGQRRPWRRQVRRRPYAEFGVGAGPREGRRGRAGRVAHLSALCPRRRCLCRGSRQPRDQERLYRVLPDRRHRALQPPRARYRQALRPRKPPARHRRRLPEGAGVAHRQADQGQVQDPADPQGHRHRRGRWRLRSITGSSGSTCRTMADASSTMAAAPCMCCPKSSTR